MPASVCTIKVQTVLGSFCIKPDQEKAPQTSHYFMELVRKGLLNNTSMFRIVNSSNNNHNPDCPIHVVQGGMTERDGHGLPPIMHETTVMTGISHQKWTVSAARMAPGETYGSFFITMRNEPSLDFGGVRHPDGQGFAAFGHVTAGYQTLERIFLRVEHEEYLRHKLQITSVTVE